MSVSENVTRTAIRSKEDIFALIGLEVAIDLVTAIDRGEVELTDHTALAIAVRTYRRFAGELAKMYQDAPEITAFYDDFLPNSEVEG